MERTECTSETGGEAGLNRRSHERRKKGEGEKRAILNLIKSRLEILGSSGGSGRVSVGSRNDGRFYRRLGEARSARTDTLESIFPVVPSSAVRAYRSLSRARVSRLLLPATSPPFISPRCRRRRLTRRRVYAVDMTLGSRLSLGSRQTARNSDRRYPAFIAQKPRSLLLRLGSLWWYSMFRQPKCYDCYVGR